MTERAATDELTELREEGQVAWRPLLRQFGIGVVTAVVLVAVLAYVLQDPIQSLSLAFVQATGLLGVFVAVLLVDTFHLTHEPILVAAYVGGLKFWPIILTATAASVLAGPLGWWIGGFLGRVGFVASFLARHRLDAFLRRYGFMAVAIAALTPIPYGPTVWAAGATGVPLRDVVLGSLFRFPKVLFWGFVSIGGWKIGSMVGG